MYSCATTVAKTTTYTICIIKYNKKDTLAHPLEVVFVLCELIVTVQSRTCIKVNKTYIGTAYRYTNHHRVEWLS